MILGFYGPPAAASARAVTVTQEEAALLKIAAPPFPSPYHLPAPSFVGKNKWGIKTKEKNMP